MRLFVIVQRMPLFAKTFAKLSFSITALLKRIMTGLPALSTNDFVATMANTAVQARSTAGSQMKSVIASMVPWIVP
jgi:hypothetical protein